MIECIPNISEGRNQQTLDAITRAIRRTGAHVLDLHIDADHHRSVVTLVGESEAVFDGVLAMEAEARDRIDLRVHRGVHPRLGAVDVIPFVPLEGSDMSECIDLAQRVGRAIADRLGIPVYLYAQAASSETRRDLATIRRGEFEGLPKKMADPEWAPDFGPREPHPTAGASVVGARNSLVAYNVVLDSDLPIAREIASTLRGSNGGLKGVKALGLPLASRGLVQVSMNLTDISATGLALAYEGVAREATLRGVGVVGSELVGLVPRMGTQGATTESLRLDRDLEDAVLENRMATR